MPLEEQSLFVTWQLLSTSSISMASHFGPVFWFECLFWQNLIWDEHSFICWIKAISWVFTDFQQPSDKLYCCKSTFLKAKYRHLSTLDYLIYIDRYPNKPFMITNKLNEIESNISKYSFKLYVTHDNILRDLGNKFQLISDTNDSKDNWPCWWSILSLWGLIHDQSYL